MILAGDLGGTKTLLGLFDCGGRRLLRRDMREYATLDFAGLPAIIDAFYASQASPPRIRAAAFGVAGPVIDRSVEMTNVPWRVAASDLEAKLQLPRVQLLNDLEAMAYGLSALEIDDLRTLRGGDSGGAGNIGLIAAGTGLGQSVIYQTADGKNAVRRFEVIASEAGHADFAARTDRELELVRFLRDRFGRAEIEHVLSGPGLQNLAEFTHRDADGAATERSANHADSPAKISAAALEGRCAHCVDALNMFVEAYGAAAGNLALAAMTTGGIFLGGGIAPKILPALEKGEFLNAFLDKGPMRPLLEAIPVRVILNSEAALLGAAVYANRMG